MRRDPLPLLLGAGAVGLLVVAAAASPRGRAVVHQAENTVTDWISTLLRKTSEHEGTYWCVQRNLDGNGVSYGIIQWTQKSGALGRLLRAMHEADADAFRRIFGTSWQALLEVTARGSLEPVDGVPLWQEPWVSRFVTAGRYAPFQATQARVAADSEYLRGAVQIARMIGVTTERALVLTYNRTVHMGVAGAIGPAERLLGWYAEDATRRPARPNDVLAQYAWLCAAKFRRTSAPAKRCYNNACNIWWEAAAEEWSELRADGAYRIARVPVRGVWHAATGPTTKPWSLYDLITRRSADILVDPTLRDLPVALPNA